MRVLITVGPTREPVDAVRFLSNRSSGRTGLAVAEAAVEKADEVVLLAGPGVQTDAVAGWARVERFVTCQQLRELLGQEFQRCDVLVMAAAVADYRPVEPASGKRQRGRAGERVTIELEPTPDLVAEVAEHKRPDQKVVAFALEAGESVLERAERKLTGKKVDAVVANDLATMEGERITAWWLTAASEPEGPAEMPKADFGHWLMERVRRL